MKILGISGSARSNGSTAFAVRYALKLAKEAGANTRYISLAKRRIEPCDGCWRCVDSGKCKFRDDMEIILKCMRWCDGLIIGSPVYFGLVSGQTKVMMDRCVPLRVKQPFLMQHKLGAGIACGAFRNGGQELTLQCIHTFMLQQNMKVLSDGPGYSHSGAALIGSARDDELGLRTVENLVRNMLLAGGVEVKPAKEPKPPKTGGRPKRKGK